MTNLDRHKKAKQSKQDVKEIVASRPFFVEKGSLDLKEVRNFFFPQK